MRNNRLQRIHVAVSAVAALLPLGPVKQTCDFRKDAVGFRCVRCHRHITDLAGFQDAMDAGCLGHNIHKHCETTED